MGVHKRDGTKKREGKQRFLKKERKAGSRVGYLKKVGWNPLTNYGVFRKNQYIREDCLKGGVDNLQI